MRKRGIVENLAYQTLRKMAMDRNVKLVDPRTLVAAVELLD